MNGEPAEQTLVDRLETMSLVLDALAESLRQQGHVGRAERLEKAADLLDQAVLLIALPESRRRNGS